MLTWETFLAKEHSRFFWSEREGGNYRCGNPDSYYLKGSDPEAASYDTGNNKALTVSGLDGRIQMLTLFKPSFYSDNIPGVWVMKDRIYVKNLSFSIRFGDEVLDLPDYSGKIRTDLIECVIPVTTYTLDSVKATAITFAPIAADGSERPRGAFYTLLVENTSGQPVSGAVQLPAPPHFSNVMKPEHGMGDIHLLDILHADSFTHCREVPFTLLPGAMISVPVWLCAYGVPWEKSLEKGVLYWLEQTLAYYRNLSGHINFDTLPFLGEFMLRTLHQCQQCIGMDPSGKLAGSTWGTNPTTYEIWMKDMYYSMLPLAQSDPALFQKGVEWFAEYGVRPSGVQFEGGVIHSLSNSLSSILMAGQYYSATGDLDFFRQNPDMLKHMSDILDEMLLSRTQEDVWLFPSVWISDGLSMGDFHTGSNLCAWAALSGFARILHALGEHDKANTYLAVAAKTRNELLTRCVSPDGPFGPQFVEGVGMGSKEFQEQMKADSLEHFREKNSGFGIQFYEFYNRKENTPYLVHDGEETDTTLASFYGLLPYDDTTFKNYTRFAMTEHNRFYCPVSRGILWEDCTDSTFPGYITGLANAVDRGSFDKYFDPIRRLADLDGSIWWWPYKHDAKDESDMKRMPGKCGWASGALLALLWHDIMGICYDGASRSLTLKPLSAVTPFCWKNAPLGGGRFDLECTEHSARVRNLNVFAVTLDVQLFGTSVSVNDIPVDGLSGAYFGKPVQTVSIKLLPGESVSLIAR